MRYALPLILLASPAAAHHEVVAVSLVPALASGLFVSVMAGLAYWRRWRKRP